MQNSVIVTWHFQVWHWGAFYSRQVRPFLPLYAQIGYLLVLSENFLFL